MINQLSTPLPPVHPDSQEALADTAALLTRVQAEPAANELPYRGGGLNPLPVEDSIDPHFTDQSKPRIQVGPGRIDDVVCSAEKCLARTGRYFQRAGSIVTVRIDPSSKEEIIEAANRTSILRDLSQAATWEKQDRRTGEWSQIDPPDRYCSILLNTREYEHLPVINGVVRQPHIRPDGSLCLTNGYDAATGLLGTFREDDFKVPVSPTREEAEAALKVLDGLLGEFVFPKASDRSAALSAMLTAATRPGICAAPMFHVRAPQSGTGKSYLCEVITAFSTARRGTPMGFPGGNEECGKLLLAELLGSPAVIEFDNLTSDILPYKSLCTALTSEYLSGRILGASKIASVRTRALFLSSGNNVGPVADMTRRCITVNLDPGCEVPAGRTFSRPNLIREVLSNRGLYVSAALTVISGWIAADRPEPTCRPLASFGDWAAWCRSPLLWLGHPDPVNSIFEGMAEDPDRECLGRLLLTLDVQFGSSPFMVKDIVRRTLERKAGAEELLEALQEIAVGRDGVNRKTLGQWMKRHGGQVVDGMRLVKSNVTRNAQSWQVEHVGPAKAAKPVDSVDPVAFTKPSKPTESVVSVSSALVEKTEFVEEDYAFEDGWGDELIEPL